MLAASMSHARMSHDVMDGNLNVSFPPFFGRTTLFFTPTTGYRYDVRTVR